MPEISITARQKFFIGINIRPFPTQPRTCKSHVFVPDWLQVAELGHGHSFAFCKGGNIHKRGGDSPRLETAERIS